MLFHQTTIILHHNLIIILHQRTRIHFYHRDRRQSSNHKIQMVVTYHINHQYNHKRIWILVAYNFLNNKWVDSLLIILSWLIMTLYKIKHLIRKILQVICKVQILIIIMELKKIILIVIINKQRIILIKIGKLLQIKYWIKLNNPLHFCRIFQEELLYTGQRFSNKIWLIYC